MYSSIEAVALRTVKHNDRSSVLTAWSPQLGRISLVMPAGTGVESRRRRALTMPLSLFECVVDRRGDNELMIARDLKGWHPEGRGSYDVSSHPVRATVAMFVAEVLSVVTREGDGDAALWSLVVETANHVAEGNSAVLANVPSMCLLRMAAVLGIEPDFAARSDADGLDLTEGVFRRTRPLHDNWAGADEMRVIALMAEASASYRHIGIVRLPRTVRNKVLDGITRYFVLHHYPLDRLRSLDILKTVFAS